MIDSETTRDTLLRGRVILHQPRRGFRSSLDPVLLAGFLSPPYGHFLDIGAGTGAVSFLLLAKDAQSTGVAVEIQERLAVLAQAGLRENTFAERLLIVGGDIRQVGESFDGAFDLVATNPPFRPVGVGNLPGHGERAMAHHEVSLTLREWAQVAHRCLRPEGRLGVIFPADRLDELSTVLAGVGLPVVASRLVLPRPGDPPIRCLVEARKHSAPGPVERLPPLMVHAESGYSPEVLGMLGE